MRETRVAKLIIPADLITDLFVDIAIIYHWPAEFLPGRET
jgi:hypothetical protein